MKEAVSFIPVMVVLFILLVLAGKIAKKRMEQTYHQIMDELKAARALDEHSAVAIKGLEKFSLKALKNHRPKVMEQLIMGKIVGVAGNDKYYLKQDPDTFKIPEKIQ